MSDSFDEEAEPSFTLGQYFKEIDEEELEADLVLGGDEGKECTYAKGYMKRQAIFSCLTCTPDGNAGVCMACTLSCHHGHDVVELWTKRNFRCDCGNSKFGVGFCKISPSKDVENAENLYNHNFRGRYCTCDGLYPDPDLEEQVEMMQCCICEDWFHGEHLGLESPDEIPTDEEGEPIYQDFICQACSGACSFLSVYPQIILATCKNSAPSKNKEECIVENALPACGSSGELENGGGFGDSVKAGCTETLADSGVAVKTLEGYSETNMQLKECTKGTTATVLCKAGVDLLASPPSVTNKPMFLPKNWRDVLCHCGNCTAFYTQKGVSFLLDPEDSIVEYEKVAKQKREEKLQQEETSDASFLDGLGHVQKIEFLSCMNVMKDEFLSFAESHDKSKVVTPDDVRNLFDNIRKKRRTE